MQEEVEALKLRIAQLEEQLRDEKMKVAALHDMINGSKKLIHALHDAFDLKHVSSHGPGYGYRHPRLKEVKGMQSRRIRTL